jgi:Skp family chaperone for outer membrane proteins
MRFFSVLLALAFSLPVFAQSDVAPVPGGGGPVKPVMPPAPPPRPAADKIATIDMSAVFNSWDKVAAFTASLEQQKQDQEKAVKELEEQVKEKIKMRDTVGMSEKVRRSIQVEIIQIQAKAEFMMKDWNAQVKQMLDEGISALYDEIREEVAKVAQAQGYTLVLAVENSKAVDDAAKGGVDERLGRRTVVYAHPGYDISLAVAQALAARYEEEKKNGGKEPVKDPK